MGRMQTVDVLGMEGVRSANWKQVLSQSLQHCSLGMRILTLAREAKEIHGWRIHQVMADPLRETAIVRVKLT